MEQREPTVSIQYPPVLNFTLYSLILPVIIVVWHSPAWWICPALWVLAGHWGHGMLLALHEAVHYHLSPIRRSNELRGTFIGTVVLLPLNAYRVLHGFHHSALAGIRDAELWPYTDVSKSRPTRMLWAFGELFLGFFVTPFIFFRGVWVNRAALEPAVRRRIAWEYLACFAFWTLSLSVVHVMGWWTEFLVAYLAPAMIAGNMQTLRKFTEHMGLFGDGPLTSTRSVVHPDLMGVALAASMLNVNHHGTHHRFGKVPYYDLPSSTPKAYSGAVEPGPLYPSYTSAFFAMLPTLWNPRVGKQWLPTSRPSHPSPTSPSPHRERASAVS